MYKLDGTTIIFPDGERIDRMALPPMPKPARRLLDGSSEVEEPDLAAARAEAMRLHRKFAEFLEWTRAGNVPEDITVPPPPPPRRYAPLNVNDVLELIGHFSGDAEPPVPTPPPPVTLGRAGEAVEMPEALGDGDDDDADEVLDPNVVPQSLARLVPPNLDVEAQKAWASRRYLELWSIIFSKIPREPTEADRAEFKALNKRSGWFN